MGKFSKFFLFKKYSDPNEYEDMIKYIIKSCMKSEKVVVGLISLFEFIFLIFSCISPESFTGYVWAYRIAYSVLLFVSITSLSLVFYIEKDYDNRYQMMKIISAVYSFIIVTWAVSITYLDAVRFEHPQLILFMTIAMCLPICAFINPLVLAIVDLYGAALIYVIIFIIGNRYGSTTISSDSINFAVFFIIQLVASMFFLYTRVGFYETTRQNTHNAEVALSATKAKSAYLANMSHEIRTPLNSILGLNELILRDSTEPDVLDYAAGINESGSTLLSLVNDILDFSKIESGKMEIFDNIYSTEELISNVSSMMDVLAKNKGLRLVLDVNPSLPCALYGDEARISQLMINLINNAIKYTTVGAVTFNVDYSRIDEDNILLKVRIIDTGIGITESDSLRLFDSFERVDSQATRNVEGTGLGLTICKRIVDLMNGHIYVNSIYGKGSEFGFEIPQKVDDYEPVATFDNNFNFSANLPVKQTSFTAPDAHILLVDDNDMNRTVFCGQIHNTEIHIDTAISGEDCLELVKHHNYDLIFMDHLMPGMNGIDTLHAIRELHSYNSDVVPVIVLTANVTANAREEYIKLGFSDYISKPVKASTILNMLKHYLPKELIKN